MPLPSDLESSLASLDNSPYLQSNTSSRPSSPNSHTYEFVLNSPGRTRPYVPSPLSGKRSTSNIRARSASRVSRTSSLSGSIAYGRESRCSVTHSSVAHSPSFLPLPPISSEPSVEFRTFLDFTFQHFSLSTAPSIHPPTPPALPALPTLSQPLFSPPSPVKAKAPRPLQLASLNHPNSPYVPWDSPVRREYFRPLTPDSFVSDFSQYSRPLSRSGARAPEPTELPEAENGRPHMTLLKVSQSIRSIRRSVKRNVAHVAKRITNLSLARSRSLDDDLPPATPRRSIVAPLPEFPPCPRRPSSPCASVDTSNTRSLAIWLESRRQENFNRDVQFMTLEDYERTGSWIDLPDGDHFVCEVTGCQFHCHVPDSPTSSGMHHDSSILRPSSYVNKEAVATPTLSASHNSRPHSSPDLSLHMAPCQTPGRIFDTA